MDATQLFDSTVENTFQKLYEDQKKAVWFPEEINVQQDMQDFRDLPENRLKFLEKQDVMTLQNFFEVTPNQYTNS